MCSGDSHFSLLDKGASGLNGTTSNQTREKTVKHFVLVFFSYSVSLFSATLLDAVSICLRYVIPCSFGKTIQRGHFRHRVDIVDTV
jgi:hypothetical protein